MTKPKRRKPSKAQGASVKPKRKIGRPPLLSLAALERFMAFGPSIEECATFFGVSSSCVEATIKREAGVSFKVFRDQAMIWCRHHLRREAIRRATKGGSDSVLIFALKNVAGWKERQELSAPEGGGKAGSAVAGFTVHLSYDPTRRFGGPNEPTQEIPAHDRQQQQAEPAAADEPDGSAEDAEDRRDEE